MLHFAIFKTQNLCGVYQHIPLKSLNSTTFHCNSVSKPDIFSAQPPIARAMDRPREVLPWCFKRGFIGGLKLWVVDTSKHVSLEEKDRKIILYIYNYNNYLVMSCPSLLFSTVWVGFDISIDLGDSMGLQPFDSQDTNSRWTLDTNMTWWNPPLKNLGISWNIMVELNLLQYIHGIHMNWLYTWGYNMV